MESLIVFAKNPILGQVKTRLAESHGHEAAVRLYTAFLLDTMDLVSRWRNEKVAVDPNRRLILYVTPESDDPVFAECVRRSGAKLQVQPPGDLGERLATIFETEFSRGARAVCAVGSDSPTLPMHLLEYAFRALQWQRVVLGPTADGGYWLVGAKRPVPDIFTDIPWSTHQVMQKTVERLETHDIEPHFLPFWYDVDDKTGVNALRWHLRVLRKQGIFPERTWTAMQELSLIGAEG